MRGNAHTEHFPYEAYRFTGASFAKVFTVAITGVCNSCFPSYCAAAQPTAVLLV